MDALLRLWADLVARASFWPAVVLAFYGLFLLAFFLMLLAQVGRALLVRWRRRRLHLVEPPDRERTLAAIATATPVITERGAWPETRVRPSGGRLAARIARRRAERGEGGDAT
ncbi:MAG: hypothetical protein AB7Q16_24015 [Vicinamibacterales bacterium]